jgi:DNA-binding XRE family transcriptional regulator
MNKIKRKNLEKAGFKIGTVQEFLGLSDEEMALIDLKVRLIEMLTSARKNRNVTQHGLAKLIGSSQSRVAKMEAADDDVSLDLICKALFSLGVSQKAIGEALTSKRVA